MSRGLIVWFLIMLAETIHGVLRGLLLVPRVGEASAGRIGLLVGTALVLIVTFLFIRWIGLRKGTALLVLGAVWALLTGVFDILIGLLRGFNAARVIAEINPLAGGPMIYSLCVMFIAPWLCAWMAGRRI